MILTTNKFSGVHDFRQFEFRLDWFNFYEGMRGQDEHEAPIILHPLGASAVNPWGNSAGIAAAIPGLRSTLLFSHEREKLPDTEK